MAGKIKGAKNAQLIIITLFVLIAICCGCESQPQLNMPELRDLKADLKADFPAFRKMTATYGEKSKDISITVDTREIAEEDVFRIVMAIREVFLDRGFQENLFEEIGIVSLGHTPGVYLWFRGEDGVSDYCFVSHYQDDVTGEYLGFQRWGGERWPLDRECYQEIPWEEMCGSNEPQGSGN